MQSAAADGATRTSLPPCPPHLCPSVPWSCFAPPLEASMNDSSSSRGRSSCSLTCSSDAFLASIFLDCSSCACAANGCWRAQREGCGVRVAMHAPQPTRVLRTVPKKGMLPATRMDACTQHIHRWRPHVGVCTH